MNKERFLNKALDVRDLEGRRLNMNTVLPVFGIIIPVLFIIAYVGMTALADFLCLVPQ